MIKIITCFWNAEDYIGKCVDSIKTQTFKDFKVYLIDDLSTDSTIDKINSLIDGDERFNLIKNNDKKFKLKNIDDLLTDNSLFDDEDIIVELDGDDWLYDDNVLHIVNSKYESNPKLWITNGSFIYSNGSLGFSSKVNPPTIRTDTFLFSHLRTWKRHLWGRIDKSSFIDENGEYFKSAGDAAYSFPMVEMSGYEHYEYIPDILYVYNDQNPRSDSKFGSASGSPFEQYRCSNIIRNMKKYNEL